MLTIWKHALHRTRAHVLEKLWRRLDMLPAPDFASPQYSGGVSLQNILPVENDRGIQHVVSLYLKDIGCVVDVASDGESGLQEVRSENTTRPSSGYPAIRGVGYHVGRGTNFTFYLPAAGRTMEPPYFSRSTTKSAKASSDCLLGESGNGVRKCFARAANSLARCAA